MKTFAIIVIIALSTVVCLGQVTVKGNVTIKGNTGLNNITFGPPDYGGAIVSNLIVPAPGTYTGSSTPLLSTACTVNSVSTSCNLFSGGYPAVVTDPSYFDWLGIHNQSTYTRCTDARSFQDALNHNAAEGIGGNSLYQLVNSNSTLLLLNVARTLMTTIWTDPVTGTHFCKAPTYLGGPADVITCGAACTFGTATRSASIVVTPNMDVTDYPAGGSNTTSFNFGSPDFDLNNPSWLWAWGPSNFQYSTNTTVTGPVVFGGTHVGLSTFVPDGSFTYTTIPIVDFYYALPMGSAVSEHAISTGYTFGQYVKHTMYLPGTATPEIYQYAINTYYPKGALIQPGANSDGVSTNTGFCVYKAGIDGGETGASLASFPTENPCIGNRVVESGCTGGSCVNQHWYGIWVAGTGTSGQNGPSFVLQAIQAGTTAGGTFSPYANGGHVACASGANACVNPDIATSITDSGAVWQNSGPNLGTLALINAAGVNLWNVTAGVSGDNKKFGLSISTNTYGPNAAGNYITAATTTSNNTAGQGSAQWAIEADTSDPVSGSPTFYTLNTASGIQTNETCSGTTLSSGAYLGGTACNTSGVTWSTPTSASFPTGSPFFALTNPSGGSTSGQPTGYGSSLQCYGGVHNEKVWYTGLAVTINISPWYSDILSTSCSNTYHYFEWLPRGPLDNGAFDPYINLQTFQAGVPHYALGKSNVWSDGGAGGGYGQTSGVMTVAYPNINVSGNNGALPVRCGTGGSGSCLICTPNSGSCGTPPTFTQEPYTFSITGSNCSSSTISNSGYPGNGMQPNVFGIFALNPTNAQNGTTSGAPPCNIIGIWDWHFDAAYDPGQNDAGWLIGVVNNASQFLPFANSAWQSEVTAYQQLPQCGGAGQPACSPVTTVGTQKRFGHTLAYATSNIFETSVQVSSSAIDGTFTAFGTEWFDQFGSYSNGGNIGAPTSLPATYVPYLGMPATLLCLCGPPWQPSYPYLVGELMDPLPPNAAQAGQGGIDVFQVTAISSAHSPYGCDVAPVSSALNGSGDMPTALWNAFNGATLGGTVTDNCVTWTDVGSNPNPRGDVILLTTR